MRKLAACSLPLAALTCLALLPATAQQVGGGGGGSSNAKKLQGVAIAVTAPSSGNCLVFTTTWGPGSCAGVASTNWSALVSGTNTTGAFLVGTGASLAATGTGTIAATSASTATACASTDGCWPKNGAYGTPASLVLTNAAGLPCGALPALTGDVTTSAGSCAATVAKVNGASVPASALAVGTNASGQLVSVAPAWVCNGAGLGDGLNSIPAGTYLQTNCYNGTGHTVTITGILCYTDNGGTSSMNAANGAGTDLLTGAVTCTASFAAGTQSGTTTLAAGDYAKFTFVADGASKQTSWVIEGTY
ncbi:MAG TPA: hypothetical protein VNE83_04690 [Terriglobales bacterium]|nr:hypothetical protein [Terriglobales bacterium]